MSNYTPKTKEFLEYEAPSFTKELAEALIERAGGEVYFTENTHLLTQNSVDGMNESTEITAFYHANKDAINNLAKEYASEYGIGSLAEFVQGFHSLSDTYEVDEVEEGLNDDSSAHHDTLAAALVRFANVELALAYERFTENDKELALQKFIKDDIGEGL